MRPLLLFVAAAFTLSVLFGMPVYSIAMDITLNTVTASVEKLDKLEMFLDSIGGSVIEKWDKGLWLSVGFENLNGLFDAVADFEGAQEVFTDVAQINAKIKSLLQSIAGPMEIIDHTVIFQATSS